MNYIKLKFNRFYNLIFGEKFYKKLDFNWDNLPRRYDLINKVIMKKNYKSYLEIGCDQNQTFDNISIDKKVGVDPIQGGNLKKTSDLFFSENKEKFDCIFIDGLHTYEQVRKDVYNSLNVLNDNGTIFIHDCLPKGFFYQAVPRSRSIWNGDVWKIIVEYRSKKDLDTCTCFIDQGVGIIKKRKNSNLFVNDIKNFKNLKFKYFYYNYKRIMNIIEYKDINDFLEI